MPRDPKPWFRSDRDAWCVTINRRRFNLGPDRELAHKRFYELMLTGGAAEEQRGPTTVFSLFDDFLEWCRGQRAESTYEWYVERIKPFVKHLKTDRPAATLRPYHVVQWVSKHRGWSTTHQRNCIQAIKRPYRWAHRMGLLDSNPLEFLEKPSAGRRDQIVTPEEYKVVLAKIPNAAFKNLIVSAWDTGARPQELLRIEMRHVDLANSRWIIPAKEVKVRSRPRIIYLTEQVAKITAGYLTETPNDRLFVNTKGEAWNRHSIKCQFFRLEKKIGRKLSLYVFRHSFATRLLTEGVDPMTVATLLGHSDTSMLGRVYQHLYQRTDHLRSQLQRVSHPAPSA
jgi:integrase